MSLLDNTFEELLKKIRQSDYLNAAKSDPIFYFVYPPEEMLALKQHYTRWTARFRDAGLAVVRVSFCDLLWGCVDQSGRWEAWLEDERDYDRSQINHAVTDVLTGEGHLVQAIRQEIDAAGPKSVVFLTETEVLHPYFRTRVIESAIHDKISIPVVIFYPGYRSGQYGLKFLGFYAEDPNYRSTMIGGL
jgi:hypothetical protein